MSHFRGLAIIPTNGIRPDGQAFTAPPASIVKAVNACAVFPERFAKYSHGRGTCDLSVLPLRTPITAAQYGYRSDNVRFHVEPDKAASLVNMLQRYDFFVTLCDTSAVHLRHNNAVYNGIASPRGFFVHINSEHDLVTMMLHEFCHYHEYLTRPIVPEGWPTCADSDGVSTAIHCGAEYNYRNDTVPGWLRDFMGSDLPDGSGIPPAAWALPSPSQAGTYGTPPRDRRLASTWRIGKPVVLRGGL